MGANGLVQRDEKICSRLGSLWRYDFRLAGMVLFVVCGLLGDMVAFPVF
ncbi:hypothetical protein l11_18950 [Neisseria weaveri LMG 5135]|nr:hypothetical protein l11_18950 [Neisseria weaveri LMG 5135]EGV38094.1 hypothetical protein l13_01890 [Neisseria weaveri ATCC 51223]